MHFAACKKKTSAPEVKLPTSNYERVQFAFNYDDYYYAIEYNIEQYAGNASLFIMFNLERIPASQATTILVNGSTKYYLDQDSSGSLVATIDLKDGDETTIFSSSVAPQPNDEYFTIDGKGRFVVKEGQGGIYIFKIDEPYNFMTITKR